MRRAPIPYSLFAIELSLAGLPSRFVCRVVRLRDAASFVVRAPPCDASLARSRIRDSVRGASLPPRADEHPVSFCCSCSHFVFSLALWNRGKHGGKVAGTFPFAPIAPSCLCHCPDHIWIAILRASLALAFFCQRPVAGHSPPCVQCEFQALTTLCFQAYRS